jgi:phage shock protein A
MGLLDRLNLLVRSNLGVLTGRDDDGDQYGRAPGHSAGQSPRQEMLVEVDATLRDARRQTAQLMRDERRIEQELSGFNDDIQRWDDRAFKALEAGDEASARDALVVKHRIATRARKAEEELSAVRSYLSDLLKSMERLEGKRALLRTPQTAPATQSPATAAPAPQTRAQAPHASEVSWGRKPHSSGEGSVREGSVNPRTQASAASRSGNREGFGDTAQKWESLTDAKVRFEGVDESLAEFERVESQVSAYEARVEAEHDLSALPISPDDPLYDPGLADLEARFRALEAQQRKR